MKGKCCERRRRSRAQCLSACTGVVDFFERAEKLRELEIIKKFNIVRNAGRTPVSNYDVALIFDFDTVETLDEYQKSRLHMEFGEFVYSIRVDRACIDFEI